MMACASADEAHWCTFKNPSGNRPLNDSVKGFHGLAGANALELDASPIGPMLERPMINGDGPKALALVQEEIKHLTPRLSGHLKSRF